MSFHREQNLTENFLMLTGEAEMNPSVDFLTFLRFLRMQKALLHWVRMQYCLTADHLGMKWGFNPSVFKYWRLCFQQRWQTRSIYRTLFYEVLLDDPNFGGAKWEWAVEMACGTWEAFLGCCSAIRMGVWVLVWVVLLPSLQGGFLPSAGGSAASCPVPFQRQSLVAFSVLEGSYWKRKPCFQGEGQL